MSQSNISKRVQAEKPQTFDPSSGLMEYEKEEIMQALAIAEAAKRIEEEAIAEDNRNLICQHIKIDMFNTLERFVELTPSMCDVRDCGWDAAREIGAGDWGNLPVDQVLQNGKTIGQTAIELKERHQATKHTVSAVNDHIISAAELKKRAWAPGQEVALR